MVSWPSVNAPAFALEQATTLETPAHWLPSAAIVTDDGMKKSVAVPNTNSAQFFRLRKP
jgi:hypothetical protein